MDGLVVDYECKRLGGIVDAVEPMEALVGYHVGDISFFGHGVAALLDEAGIPVVALSGHNLPVVESLGHCFEVPLAYDGSLISGIPEIAGPCGL